MYYRMPDFDLRPRRSPTVSTPMLSTWSVDDEGDTLAALAAATAAAPLTRQRDARHVALAALPSALCAPVADAVWSTRRAPPRRRRSDERVLLGTVISAGLAVLMLVAAMLWHIERPRVIYLEGAPVDVRGAAEPAVDAISSASP